MSGAYYVYVYSHKGKPMIHYDLKCANGHCFDSWFSSSEDFEKLSRTNMLGCVVCGNTVIQKAVMAPRVASGEDKKSGSPTLGPAREVGALRAQIEAQADDVGRNFAAEARKIHDGEAPKRAIYGEARIDEAKSLIRDGVPVLPLPWSSRKVN